MSALKDLENALNDIFVKKAPALPVNVKKVIVQYLPWINLVLGLLALTAAWGLYRAAHTVNRLADLTNSLSTYYGGQYAAPRIGIAVWIALIVLVVQAVIYLMAFTPLRARVKRGWDLLFFAALIGIVYGIVAMFSDINGAGRLFYSLLSAVVEFYFLFQIRDMYLGHAKTRTTESKS